MSLFVLNEICFHFSIWCKRSYVWRVRDYRKYTTKYNIKIWGTLLPIYGTEKLVGCLTEVEIVIFKLVFSLYVSKDITECLLALSHWLLLHRRNFWGVSEQRLFLSSNTYFRRILNKCSVVSKLNKGRLPFGILRFPLDVGFHILLVTQETS